MNVLFLMDPLEIVDRDKDTSFILMLEVHRRGYKIFYLPDGGMTRRDGKIFFHVTQVIPQKTEENPFIKLGQETLTEEDVDIIFVRSDPPFDHQYLLNTWLLELLPKRIPVINAPHGLRTVNEKIWAAQFTSLTPPTLIGRNRQDLLDFAAEQKHVVAKPTDGHGGKSIFQIQSGDFNTNVILETLTQNWSTDIILQKFIPEAMQGDKRILLLDGEPLGAILRVHAKDDHRNNLFAGGKPAAVELNARDKAIIDILRPELRRLGLYFVGIDILGDYLIEVNVTSPTCLQEMNRLYNTALEANVVDCALRLWTACQDASRGA